VGLGLTPEISTSWASSAAARHRPECTASRTPWRDPTIVVRSLPPALSSPLRPAGRVRSASAAALQTTEHSSKIAWVSLAARARAGYRGGHLPGQRCGNDKTSVRRGLDEPANSSLTAESTAAANSCDSLRAMACLLCPRDSLCAWPQYYHSICAYPPPTYFAVVCQVTLAVCSQFLQWACFSHKGCVRWRQDRARLQSPYREPSI
jgi:hypothetical protein